MSRITLREALFTSATKGAVDSITQVLSKELGPKKIRVNRINPGMVETEGTHTAGFIGSDFQKWAETTTPLGRIGQPEDISLIAVFLASDDSGWLTRRNYFSRVADQDKSVIGERVMSDLCVVYRVINRSHR